MRFLVLIEGKDNDTLASGRQIERSMKRILAILEIIPLKLCLKQWCWLLTKLGRI